MKAASARYAVLAGVTAAALAACSPLPGSALDPVYLKVGRHSAVPTDTTPPPSAPATPAPTQPSGPQPPAPPSPAQPVPAQPSTAALPTSGSGAWAGQYQDNRGSGGISLSLVQRESVLSGTWKLRTGGGGPFNGTIAPDGRITFRMENVSAECPGKFEGWAELRGSSLIGAYHGQDCEGVITDGRLDVARR